MEVAEKRSSFRRISYFDKYRLKRRVIKQRKFINGKSVTKNRTIFIPVDKKFHVELLADARKYFWMRGPGSFGSMRGINPQEFMSRYAGADLCIQCDIANYFPSITAEMAEEAIKKYTSLPRDAEGQYTIMELLRSNFASTPLGGILAQGTNAAPLIANCVGTEIDLKMRAIIRKEIALVSAKYEYIHKTACMLCNATVSPKAIEFIEEYLPAPSIDYARYVDNIAIFFWNFPDSFHHLKLAREIDKASLVKACEPLVIESMRLRGRLWYKLQYVLYEMGLKINKDKTKFRRKYSARKPINFVGMTLNARPRAAKKYIEKLRCELHQLACYWRDCLDKKAFIVKNPKYLQQLKGRCVWVYSCDPQHQRINKPLSKAIELEGKVIGTRVLSSLRRFI